MQNNTRKNIIYSILLIVIVTVGVYYYTNDGAGERSDATDFAIEDISSIGRIVMTDKANNLLDLKRSNGQWKVNGKFKAMKPKIDVLLETVSRLEVHFPVSKPKMENVLNEISVKSTKVEIYKKGENQPSKVYYVGGDTEDSYGTYMIMEVDGKMAERPYVMHLPELEGILSPRYYINETEWRDTGIFDYEFDDIKKVTLDYPQMKEHSFELIVFESDSFLIKPLYEEQLGKIRVFKSGVIKYLSSFSFLNAEGFNNESSIKDSITATTPFAIITVHDKEDISKKMIVFYKPLSKRSKLQYDQQGKKLPYDLDRYYALINDGQDFVIIQNFVFGKIFRKYGDFFVGS